MKTITFIRGAGLSLAAASALLTGCAAPSTPPLYQWDGYQRGVYDYFKAEKSPQEQIDALEKSLQKIRAQGHRPPPGFEAQLGVLYATVGNDEQAMQAFQAEKDSFPESALYMDFLMKKKAGGKDAGPDPKPAVQPATAPAAASAAHPDTTAQAANH
ncbi:DUF4810 domain-containing protein [Burkholderia gladioli]|jgi:hypothetical protein|uniref:DUF4810 domain-containing protein n=1 Tax=Burkholderia gladioli TaxID=28095 RepID=A0AAW3F188_BURGA|nr:DUF4810 domain-containing protein [Burkholderia gladioli]AJW96984.1 hypothetical protein BM43_5208 [Burkholderia gladioli]ASD82037.1 DUF4810 domain-containing protein [Burkholderia gladioli pv. gladioli]AWY52291.1 DUF4810 domain-containing protein [Burkholderia gladioli pv. gladioli]KGC14246.1 hypothetical protein DM48_2558 [Burkholderia gladioli]MDJ1165358.1 DUF4810 domain-containing protein [Burkholderia gladioli pv. gladioli]